MSVDKKFFLELSNGGAAPDVCLHLAPACPRIRQLRKLPVMPKRVFLAKSDSHRPSASRPDSSEKKFLE